MNIVINLKQGLDNISFGMTMEQVMAQLGSTAEVENTTNALDEPLTILQYGELGLSFFFEGENPTLQYIDICNEDATLFGEFIFGMNEEEIIHLMHTHGYTEPEVEDEDWGERSISYASANADFYFEDSELLSLNIGQ